MKQDKVQAKWNGDGTSLVLTFQDAGKTERIVDISKMNPAMLNKLCTLGLKTKALAGTGGSSVSAEDAVKLYDSAVARLESGTWNGKRSSGNGTVKLTSLEVLANAVVKAGSSKSYDEVLAMVQGLSKGDLASLRATPAVRAAMAELKPSAKRTTLASLGF
jgi:hypothetical protein